MVRCLALLALVLAPAEPASLTPGPRRAPAGECKEFMLRYLKCMKAAKQQSTDCRHLSKDYLKCRMDKCVRLSRSLARTFESRT